MRKLLIAFILIASQSALATVPSAFSVEGVLRDSSGKLQSMMVNVTASLWDAQTAGNKLAGPYGPTAVMAESGLFTFPINDAALTTDLGAAAQVWLEVTVGNDTFARQLVTPQLYALMCGTADSLSGVLPISHGGTGSATQSFVDLTTDQTLGGAKTFSNSVTTNGWLISSSTPQPTLHLRNLANGADQKIAELMMGGTNVVGRFVKDDYSAATNWMEVYRGAGTAVTAVNFPNGNVGIGRPDSIAPLEMAQGVILLDGRGLIAMNRYYDGVWRYRNDGTGALIDTNSDSSGGMTFFVNGAGTKDAQVNGDVAAIHITPTGLVGLGTATPDQLLTVNGNASKSIGGLSWTTFSDERLKNIRGAFAGGLAQIMQLQPIRYEYKKDNAVGLVSKGEQVGFSAQAVKKVLPEAVSMSEKGYLMVNSDPILWSMLNAVKEQQREIQSLRARLDQLQRASNRRAQAN